MGDFTESSELMSAAIVSFHNAGHAAIPVMLKLLAKEYDHNGIKSFLPPVDETHTAQIIQFPNPDEITS